MNREDQAFHSWLADSIGEGERIVTERNRYRMILAALMSNANTLDVVDRGGWLYLCYGFINSGTYKEMELWRGNNQDAADLLAMLQGLRENE